ncbi:MAG: hypothetical protein CBE16_12765 [Rhodospirillaceae bacterium TMED256]|nr:MAG: hypothetical protein CBE16_12765 [Rhodospirillaceae bacterium TMED256]|tara:strand:+ start:1259 stop:1867 length:609 start_codon:yes stop_codon:yes gene_type:complete
MAIGYSVTAELGRTQKESQLNDFFASLTTSESDSLTQRGAKETLIEFKNWQNQILNQQNAAVAAVVGITSRCAVVNDSDGLVQVYPQNVPIDEFNHPEGTTVVGIGSTYFTGPSGSCTVHAGWKYTTESGFFNPNLPTNSDLFKTLRETRDVLLNQSDWTRMDDNQLSSDKKAEWATYRQALRDLPANTADPANPTYPTKPS